MAISKSKSKTIYAPASSTYGYTLKAEFTETATSSADNTSTISCSASLGASKIAFNVSGGGTLAVYWHDNNTNTDTLVKSISVEKCGNGGGSNYGTKTASGTITPTHKSDGTLSGYAKAVFTKNKSNSYIPPTSNVSTDNTALTSIPRQANVTAVTNINDEQNPTITYSNGAGNAVTSLQACIALTTSSAQSNPEVAYRDIPKTGTSYTFQLTEAERTALRNGTTGVSRNLWYYVKTILNGVTYYSYKIGTFTIVNGNPVLSGVTYEDTNSTTTAITQNDQQIIQNKSTLQITATSLQSKKGASLASISVNINGNVQTTSLSGTSIASQVLNYGVVDVSEDTNATITLTDSRGLTSNYTLPITMLSYYTPTAIITAYRDSNFYTQSKINVDANYASLDEHNNITIQFRIKKVEDSTWGSWVTIQDNTLTSFNADNEFAWDLQVQLTDALNSVQSYTLNKALDVGIPIVFYDVAKRSVGVNVLPTHDTSFEVQGGMYVNGEDITNKTYCTIKTSGDVQTTPASTGKKLTLATFAENNGFSVSSGSLVCPKSGVLVISASAMLSPRTGYAGILINKNSTRVFEIYEPAGSQTYGCLGVPAFILSVQQGDTISMYGASSSANDVFKESDRTRLTAFYL